MTLPNLSTLTHDDVKRPSQTGAYRAAFGNTWEITQDMIDRIEKAAGGGDCLYHCFIGIAKDHGERNMSAEDMRMNISTWISHHRDYFIETWHGDMKAHLEKEGILNGYPKELVDNPQTILETYLEEAVEASNGGYLTYGSDVEIDAFAQRYSIQVDLYQHRYTDVFGAYLTGQFSPANAFPEVYPNPNLPYRQIIQSFNHFDYVGLPPLCLPVQPAASSQEPPPGLIDFKEVRRIRAEREKRAKAASQHTYEEQLEERRHQHQQQLQNRMEGLLLRDDQRPVAPPEPPPDGEREQETEEERRMRRDIEAARRLQEQLDDEALAHRLALMQEAEEYRD